MRNPLLTGVLSAALLTVACGAALQRPPTTAPQALPGPETLLDAAGEGFTNLQTRTEGGVLTLSGVVQGAPFIVMIPQNWTGDALLYTHGYVTPDRTPTESFAQDAAQNFQGIAPFALSQGYAFAASGYAKTGYAVRSAIRTTQALRDLLGRLGTTRAYLIGFSMGGNVIQGLIEKHPQSYAGALPLCGAMGGWLTQIGYLTDFRVVYDHYTKPLGAPFALPGAGDATTPNPALTRDAVQASVGALFLAARQDPRAAQIIRDIAAVTVANPDPITFTTMLAGNATGLQDLLQTAGGFPYGNTTRTYQGSSDDIALNRGVQRIVADAGATAFVNDWYTPTGEFTTKVLSVHNTIDPLVPFEHQAALRAITTKANNTTNLVQRAVDARAVNLTNIAESGPTHCYFTPTQVLFAFNELRNWVEKDERPQDNLNITNR